MALPPAPEGDEPTAFPDPRDILRAYGLRPRKDLGQHFLTDRAALGAIVTAAGLGPEDRVLEIGPGLGVLTMELVRRAGRVVAVELDAEMRMVLKGLLGTASNLEVVDADILGLDLAAAMGFTPGDEGTRSGYKVVANLPYQITSAAIRHVLESRVRPERAVVMVQAEVAERILATPGDLSILAVGVQFYARPSLVTRVPAAAFHPAPRVDSAVLRLDVHVAPPVAVPSPEAFFQVVRAGFSQKRKQLRNSLASGLGLGTAASEALLAASGIDATRRAETLELAEWAELARRYDAAGESAGEVPPRQP